MSLSDFVTHAAREHGVPGAAAAVLTGGERVYASHGVTSIRDPLPIDEHTLFPIASVSKTITATALLRLAAADRVDLHAPVRRYVPGLTLADPAAAAQITVLQLLNHTAGLDWNLLDTDEGSLADFVAKLGDLPQIAPPGTRASYSQAGYNLAGRVVETVTGQPFEKAVTQLVLAPAGLHDTFYAADDVMLRRYAVGYNRDDHGDLRPAHPWKAYVAGHHGNNPGGGAVSTAADLLTWAEFHLGDGAGVLPADVLHSMRRPTVELRASTLGDALGICWFLRDVGGVTTIGHGGSGNGQFTDLLIVPAHRFAVVSLANAGPGGYPFNQAVARWALEHYLGAVDRDPEPAPYDDTRARAVTGRYQIDAMNLDIAADGTRLTLAVGIKPEIRAASDADMPPDYPPAAMGFLPGDGDEYIITEGGLQGQRGYFTRDTTGTVVGVDLAGRLFPRTP